MVQLYDAPPWSHPPRQPHTAFMTPNPEPCCRLTTVHLRAGRPLSLPPRLRNPSSPASPPHPRWWCGSHNASAHHTAFLWWVYRFFHPPKGISAVQTGRGSPTPSLTNLPQGSGFSSRSRELPPSPLPKHHSVRTSPSTLKQDYRLPTPECQ